MNTYVALLRGINVSGQKKIKMADLRAHLKTLPFQDIQTYIQSGNIVFEAESMSKQELASLIEQNIMQNYGFEVPVMIKTPKELENTLENNPFLKDPSKDSKRFYVTFLAQTPIAGLAKKLEEVDYSPEEYVLQKDLIYFFSPQGYGRAKMNNNFFEKKLKVAATTRNWRTIHKLLEMSAQ